MITWTSIEDSTPEKGEWVLATYMFRCRVSGRSIWCKRIVQWDTTTSFVGRKVTHWTYINTPE